MLILLISAIAYPVDAQIDTLIQLPSQTVWGDNPVWINTGELKTVPVRNNPVFRNLSTAELLRQVPSLVTDIEGGILFRGSMEPGMLLNGITYGWLEEYNGDILIQLPANFFRQVTVTSFPPIEWMASGEAGVINLIPESWLPDGSPLMLQAGGGWHERYNAGAILNVHPGKFHITTKYNYRKDYRKRIFRKTTTDATGTAEMNNNAAARPDVHLSDMLIAYDLTTRDRLAVYGIFQTMEYDRYGLINNRKTNPAGELANHVYRHRNNSQGQTAYGAEARWLHSISDHSGRIEIILNINDFAYEEDNHYQNEMPDTGQILAEELLDMNHDKKNYFLSAVFHKTFAADWKLTAGYTTLFRRESFKSAGQLLRNGEWVANTPSSYSYDFDRDIYTLFGGIGKCFGSLEAEAGLQAEWRGQTVESIKVNQIHLYPRLKAAYLFNNRNQIYVHYLQRANRPYGKQLNPYIDTSDNMHIRQGNPELKDEYIHSVESGYNWEILDFKITPVIFYRYRENRMTEFAREQEGQTIWSNRNAGHSHTVGGELSMRWRPWKWIGMGWSGTIFRDEIDGRIAGYNATQSLVCWDTKVYLQADLPSGTGLIIDGFYISDQLTPQGKIRSRGSLNAGITQSFTGSRLSFSLTIQNLFDSMEEITVVHTGATQIRQVRNRDARAAWISLSYLL